MPKVEKKSFNLEKIWHLQYRVYAMILLIVLVPVFYASENNIRERIPVENSYQVIQSNFFANQLEKIPDSIENPSNSLQSSSDSFQGSIQIYDKQGQILTRDLQRVGINMGFIRSQAFVDMNLPLDITKSKIQEFDKFSKTKEYPKIVNQDILQQTALDTIKPAPKNPIRINWLSYPKYKIQTPIIYTAMRDLFQLNTDGSVNFFKPIEEDPRELARGNHESTPAQRKLKNGILHIAYSPMPGELGNSYIVGHSSNYANVDSDYNYIFKPLESASKPGEEFYIYDYRGRELKFCVFETLKVAAEDITQAYKVFDGERVVTLQTSILGYRNGRREATHRWLTRGRLCD